MISNYYDPGFHGTENYYKHLLGFKYSDSVKHFAEEYGAYWLLDVIGSYGPYKQPFLIMTLDVKDNRATFTIKEDTDKSILIRQKIEFTDCKVSVRFYFIDGVLIFPSDY